MRNHTNDRKLLWRNSIGQFVQVRFMTSPEIQFLLKKVIKNDKVYVNIKGSEWRSILESELAFRNQSVDRLFFSLLLKNNSLQEKKDILYLLNPDLTVKETTELAKKLMSNLKDSKVLETM